MMRPFNILVSALCFSFLIFIFPTAAHEATIGKLVIGHPEMRFVAPGVRRTAGFVSIKNIGDTGDRLISASAKFADKVEIHTMKMDGDVMMMRPLPGGIEIPAKSTIYLEPGGLHLMFIDLSQELIDGDWNPVELTFEKAGKVLTYFQVERVIERRTQTH